MKIVIKESASKKGFRLILPYHFMVNIAVRKSWIKMGLKYRDKESMKDEKKAKEEERILEYLEALDFGELREALHGLSLKSGLVLVEVHSSDGAHIKIET